MLTMAEIEAKTTVEEPVPRDVAPVQSAHGVRPHPRVAVGCRGCVAGPAGSAPTRVRPTRQLVARILPMQPDLGDRVGDRHRPHRIMAVDGTPTAPCTGSAPSKTSTTNRGMSNRSKPRPPAATPPPCHRSTSGRSPATNPNHPPPLEEDEHACTDRDHRLRRCPRRNRRQILVGRQRDRLDPNLPALNVGTRDGIYRFDDDGHRSATGTSPQIQREINTSWAGGPVPGKYAPPKDEAVDSAVG